jgi:hypothetical protein
LQRRHGWSGVAEAREGLLERDDPREHQVDRRAHN